MPDNNHYGDDTRLDDILKSLDKKPLQGITEDIIQEESYKEETEGSDLQSLVDGIQEEINPNYNSEEKAEEKKPLHKGVILGVVILLLGIMGFGAYSVVSKKIANDKQAEMDKIQAALDAEEKEKEEKQEPELTEDKSDLDSINSSILNTDMMESPKLPEFVAGYRDTLDIPCNIYGMQMSPGFVQYVVEIDYNGNNYLTNIPYEVYVRMKSPNIVTVDIEYYYDANEKIYITSVTLNQEFMNEVIETYNEDMELEEERLEEKKKKEEEAGSASGSFEEA